MNLLISAHFLKLKKHPHIMTTQLLDQIENFTSCSLNAYFSYNTLYSNDRQDHLPGHAATAAK
jgi:hypothetical protein